MDSIGFDGFGSKVDPKSASAIILHRSKKLRFFKKLKIIQTKVTNGDASRERPKSRKSKFALFFTLLASFGNLRLSLSVGNQKSNIFGPKLAKN